jgi:hypothetical protein
MMVQRKEQLVCIKFCSNLGKSAMESLTMIQQAFMEQILSCTQAFSVACPVQDRRTSVDDEHTRRPTSCTIPETVAQIQKLVHQDVRPFTTLLRRWELVVGHTNRF